MSEEKTITKARALELAKNVSDAMKTEAAAAAALSEAKKNRLKVASEAAAELTGVIFETQTGDKVYVAGVKGGNVGFRKALPKQVEKAVAEGVSFIKLPASTTLSAS